jgi:opacity protein-like surface antigen
MMSVSGSKFGGAAVAIALAALAITPAHAQYASRFAGVYIGGNAGYQFGDGDDAGYRSPAKVFLGTFGDATANGISGGAQIGASAALARSFVAGFEGDFQLSSGDGKATLGPVTTKSEIANFSTARGRAGIVVGNTLIYGTAGVAFTTVDYSGIAPSGKSYSQSELRTGLAAGGGFEVALDGWWSAKVEGLHISTGKHVIPVSDGSSTQETASFTVVRGGLNYKF